MPIYGPHPTPIPGSRSIEVQTQESERDRGKYYAIARMVIRAFALVAGMLEIILIGPAFPAFVAVAGIAYGLRRGAYIFKTAPKKLVRPGLQRDAKFMGLFVLAVVTGYALVADLWFPLWFTAGKGYLWWHTPVKTGRFLPFLGALPVWVWALLIVALPVVSWEPLKVLDWVYKMESVVTNYRNVTFAPVDPSVLESPLGHILPLRKPERRRRSRKTRRCGHPAWRRI
jgi:hypothetical protein